MSLVVSTVTSTVVEMWLRALVRVGRFINGIQTQWYLLLYSLKLKHAIFIHWENWVGGGTTATELAAEFYGMTAKWADEFSDYSPLPEREAFYISASLQFGDPRIGQWMTKNGAKFQKFFCEFYNKPYPAEGGAEAMIQYMLWYERDGPKLDISLQSHTE